MLITTEGVVISIKDAGDTGCYIKVLSPEMGLIDIKANGTKKQNSSSNASAQLFVCSTFCFNEKSGRYYLNSCQQKKTFYGLRLDMQKLSLASYLAEIVSYAVTENQSAKDVYRLFMNSLYMISEKDASCDFIKFIFEMRITAELGLMPGLIGCADCNRSDDVPLYFLIKQGIFLCQADMSLRCEHQNRYNVPVTAGMFEAMRFVCLTHLDKIFNFKLSDEALEKLCYISENYATLHFDRYFKTLDFYKNISKDYT